MDFAFTYLDSVVIPEPYQINEKSDKDVFLFSFSPHHSQSIFFGIRTDEINILVLRGGSIIYKNATMDEQTIELKMTGMPEWGKPLYRKIECIAKELHRNNTAYTRADLAYELREVDPSIRDSFEVSRWVWEAYVQAGRDSGIRTAFLTNEGTRYVVDDYELTHCLAQHDSDDALQLVRLNLEEGDKALGALRKGIEKALLNYSGGRGGSDLLGTLAGSRGVSKVKDAARVLFKRYSTLVDAYLKAKNDVKTSIADFVALRQDIAALYKEYAGRLVDIYGESVKVIAPDMFDFDAIQYLDVEGMLRQAHLEFDQLSEQCTLLLGEITDNFSHALQASAAGYRGMGSKGAGIVMAACTMLNHYLDANTKSVQCKQQLELLKEKLRCDVATIRGDGMRLGVIYKTLNDLYIPKANAFYKYSGRVLDDELEGLWASVYQAPEIKSLADERDKTFERLKQVESMMTDCSLNIDYYTAYLKQARSLLQSKTGDYQQAVLAKPHRPFFLFNWFTFGACQRCYNRDLYDWNSVYAPIVREYEDYQADIKLAKEELQNQRTELRNAQQEHQQLDNDWKQLNRDILAKIRVSDTRKLQMLDHLEPLLRLLRLAKDIIESKLDPKLMQTISIAHYQQDELPADLQTKISSFAQALRNNLSAGTASAREAIRMANSRDADASSQEEVESVANIQNEVLQRSVNLFEIWGYLKAQQEAGKLSQRVYNQELSKLQRDFQKEMQAVDDKSALLRETLKRVNTATTPEQLKAGLLALAPGNPMLSKEDLDQFLQGNKTLNI